MSDEFHLVDFGPLYWLFKILLVPLYSVGHDKLGSAQMDS